MARYIANGTGVFSTAATWDTVTNTPTINAATNITASNVAIFSATFTAPNTTNKCTGVLVYLNVKPGSSINYTATLQESTVDTAAAVTILNANMDALGWMYFRFATPYTFTTTTAGAYRFKLIASGSTGATVGADSGGSNFAYYATDDRHTAPVAGDDIIIHGLNNTTAVAVTITGTGNSIGSGTDTTGLISRSVGLGCYIGHGGTLIHDTVANSTLTSKGSILVGISGEYDNGTVGTPMPVGITSTLSFNENAVSGNYGLLVLAGGKWQMQGTPKSSTTLWKTTFVSGVGSIADPLIVADAVNWSVGDAILVCASSNNATNYLETEEVSITTVNSATSYVLNTPLVNTHTSAYILNISRNVILNSTSTTAGCFVYNAAPPANVLIAWGRFENVGSGVTNRLAVQIGAVTAAGATCDYSVIYNQISGGFRWNSTAVVVSHTGLIVYKSSSGAGSGIVTANTSSNISLIDCFAVSQQNSGFGLGTTTNMTLTRCVAISCNNSNSATAGGGFLITNLYASLLTNCEVHCNRAQQITITANSIANTFNNMLFGTKGTSLVDIKLTNTGAYSQTLFDNCTFTAATFVTGNTTALLGTSVYAFNKMGGTNYNHTWYTAYGSAQATGSGLTDTNVRTAGTYNVRIAAADVTTGFTYSYYKPVSASSAVSALGFIQQNAALTGDAASIVKVSLYLPGNQQAGATADATYTMAKTDNNFDPFVIGANYTGIVAGLARIDINVKTTTASAYAYVADLDNGGNSLENFKIWLNGQPSPVMTETLGDATAIWAAATSSMTAAGSIGARLKNALTTGQFIGLK